MITWLEAMGHTLTFDMWYLGRRIPWTTTNVLGSMTPIILADGGYLR